MKLRVKSSVVSANLLAAKYIALLNLPSEKL